MLAAFSRLSLRGFVPSLTTNVHRRVLNSTPATRAFSVSQPTFDPAAKTRAAAKAAPKTKAKPSKKATAVKKKPAKKTTKTAAAKKPVKKPAKKVAKKPVKPAAIKLKAEDMPPSAPGSPFILFYRKYYQGADLSRADNKRAELLKLTSEAGRVWKSLSEHEKQAFKDEYKTLYADYEKRRDEYFKTVDPAVLREINKRRVKKSKSKIHAPPPLRPVRPFTPYILYVMEQRKALPPVEGWEKNKDLTREIAAKWTALPEADKKPYRDQYEQAKSEQAAAA